jgi:hypothetical protein
MPKTHLAVCKPNKWGGHQFDTLCGRESGALDEKNAEGAEAKVTCKICLAIIEDKKHWRHRKWLTPNAPAKRAAESGSGLGVELGGKTMGDCDG